MNKTCTKCKIEYPATPEYFYRYIKGKNYLRPECKKCSNVARKKYGQTKKGKQIRERWERSEKRVLQKANYHFQRDFNLTLEQYDKMFKEQNGVCFLCGKPELDRRLSVDHNHKTGKIRKLLCRYCNFRVGYVENDMDLIKCIFDYIKNY